MDDDEAEKSGMDLQPQAQVLAEFVENQKRELEIRATEVQLKAQQDKHSFEHAQRVLEAQARDRQAQREFAVKYAWHRYVFIGFIVVAAFIFLGVLAGNGQGALALEVLKGAVYLAAGAISGFFYGKSRRRHEAEMAGPQDADDD